MAQPIRRTLLNAATYANLLFSHQNDSAERVARRDINGASRAVLVVPGYLGPHAVVAPLAKRFELAGTPAFTLDLGLYTVLPFQVATGLLVKRIRNIRNRFPNITRIDIVAHSAGGLIAMDALPEIIRPGCEIRLVTLGTPFRGTWAALLGCAFSYAAVQMLPLHPRCQGPVKRAPSGFAFLSVAGSHDFLAPPKQCVHPDARTLVLPVDHAELLLRKKVYEPIASFLADH